MAEDRAPGTRSAAVVFLRELAVRPDFFGTGFRERVPYESAPAENDDAGVLLHRVTGGTARFVARWDDLGREA
ncbi:hypothetical protein ACIF80_21980 [Streptomyces sp. NPDC085927]|uniref:hypothetical protein n=1 Tax=Streptomyces sp. NPDC085927 TaxID=3365738 RepID=UPI0037D4BEB9